MIIENPAKEDTELYFYNLKNYLEQNKQKVWTKYIDLGCKIVRLVSFSDKFTPLVEKQLTYTLKNESDFYDSTIVMWEENDFTNLPSKISPDFTPAKNLKLRIELILSKQKEYKIYVKDNEYSIHSSIMEIDPFRGFLNAYDKYMDTYYYGVRNLEPEEFIKEGHIFVQMLNKISKTDSTNLVHGAVVGLENQGVLLCARGQRGKSTLAVLSMLKGFEYVSDDYLILQKDKERLYSYPIYSIITLSPRMYNELYEELEGSRFISNNARKDKYVINIANHHSQFRRKYPISICMFPEIVDDINPSILECSNSEKGRAITHLIHSTINQTQDQHDIKTIKKLTNFVKDFKFYKINLCNDIYKNVECLRTFLKEEIKNDKLCIK